jgi:hypothetical protein
MRRRRGTVSGRDPRRGPGNSTADRAGGFSHTNKIAESAMLGECAGSMTTLSWRAYSLFGENFPRPALRHSPFGTAAGWALPRSDLRVGDVRLGPMYTGAMRDSISQPTDQLQKSDALPACDRSSWPVWVGRVGEPQPKADYGNLTPSQRIALCWEATKQAWAITGTELDESAFRRDSESFSRRGG